MNREPPIAGVLMSSVAFNDTERASLALIRTRFHTEGSLLLEVGTHDDLSLVASGTWRITSVDDGPCVLSVEIDDPDVFDDVSAAVVDKLMAELLKLDRWGFEAVETLSESN